MEVKKIKMRKDGTKYLIVPKNSDLEEGEYVSISKLNSMEAIS